MASLSSSPLPAIPPALFFFVPLAAVPLVIIAVVQHPRKRHSLCSALFPILALSTLSTTAGAVGLRAAVGPFSLTSAELAIQAIFSCLLGACLLYLSPKIDTTTGRIHTCSLIIVLLCATLMSLLTPFLAIPVVLPRILFLIFSIALLPLMAFVLYIRHTPMPIQISPGLPVMMSSLSPPSAFTVLFPTHDKKPSVDSNLTLTAVDHSSSSHQVDVESSQQRSRSIDKQKLFPLVLLSSVLAAITACIIDVIGIAGRAKFHVYSEQLLRIAQTACAVLCTVGVMGAHILHIYIQPSSINGSLLNIPTEIGTTPLTHAPSRRSLKRPPLSRLDMRVGPLSRLDRFELPTEGTPGSPPNVDVPHLSQSYHKFKRGFHARFASVSPSFSSPRQKRTPIIRSYSERSTDEPSSVYSETSFMQTLSLYTEGALENCAPPFSLYTDSSNTCAETPSSYANNPASRQLPPPSSSVHSSETVFPYPRADSIKEDIGCKFLNSKPTTSRHPLSIHTHPSCPFPFQRATSRNLLRPASARCFPPYGARTQGNMHDGSHANSRRLTSDSGHAQGTEGDFLDLRDPFTSSAPFTVPRRMGAVVERRNNKGEGRKACGMKIRDSGVAFDHTYEEAETHLSEWGGLPLSAQSFARTSGVRVSGDAATTKTSVTVATKKMRQLTTHPEDNTQKHRHIAFGSKKATRGQTRNAARPLTDTLKSSSTRVAGASNASKHRVSSRGGQQHPGGQSAIYKVAKYATPSAIKSSYTPVRKGVVEGASAILFKPQRETEDAELGMEEALLAHRLLQRLDRDLGISRD